MPGLNGTGPMGMGPMTGGGRGRCNPYRGGIGYRRYGPYHGYPSHRMMPYGPGMYAYRPFGFGRGRGLGRGRGRRWWHVPYPPYGVPMRHEDELDFLKGEMDFLRQEMEAIDARIKELEKREQ